MMIGELQTIMDLSGSIRAVGQELREAGYRNTKYYKPTKEKDLQEVAKACDQECQEVDRGKYWLFGSIGHYDGYEWIWLEQTRKNPQRYTVQIWAKKE